MWETQWSRNRAENWRSLMKIGMASGQPPGEEGKAQRDDPATKATDVESGQPQAQPETVQCVDQIAGTTRSAAYLNSQTPTISRSSLTEFAAVLTGPPETEVTEETEKDSVLKKLDQNQQMSQGGTAP